MISNREKQRYRDRKIEDFLHEFKIATTDTLHQLFFSDVSLRMAQKRLEKLADYYGIIKREKDHFTHQYYYYIPGQKPKQLRHRLLVTSFYRELHKLGVEIQYFLTEKTIGDIRPDGIIGYTYRGKSFFVCVEVQIANYLVDLKKYQRFYLSEDYLKHFKKFPTIIAITNKKVPQIKELEVIRVNEDMSNIATLIKGVD